MAEEVEVMEISKIEGSGPQEPQVQLEVIGSDVVVSLDAALLADPCGGSPGVSMDVSILEQEHHAPV